MRRKKPKSAISEKTIENNHVDEWTAKGWKAWKQSGLGRMHRPDRHYMGPNNINAQIEWKKPDNSPTTAQAWELDDLETMGHYVAACTNVVDGNKFLYSIIERTAWAKTGWRMRWYSEHPTYDPLPSKRKAK